MYLKNTAKFGIHNNESIIDRFKTQITENIGRSDMLIGGDESHMNVSELQLPRDDFIIVNGVHKVAVDDGTIYRCPICDRLRAICPYKNYKTYEYCQKCTNPEQLKRPRPRIFEDAGHSISKDLSSTFNETRGYSVGVNKHLEEVNKVRFVQTNNVYPLSRPVSRYQVPNEPPNQFIQTQQQRPRATSTYEFKQTLPVNHHVIREQTYQPPKIEEIIFYPVIHNKLVYKSAKKADSDQVYYGETAPMGRSRYQSHHENKKNRKNIDRVVTDFLQTTKPDEVLTPSQFKKLADSIYRENNPNSDQS